MLGECRCVKLRAVTFVFGETIDRECPVHVVHQTVARYFSDNRCGSDGKRSAITADNDLRGAGKIGRAVAIHQC